MLAESPLSRVQREMLAFLVYRANSCHYSAEVHVRDFPAVFDDPSLAQAINRDPMADLSVVDQALCDHAVKLTRTPYAMSRQDVEKLRSLGLSDRAIHDATQVVAFFNYINRIADGLGIDLEPGMPAR